MYAVLAGTVANCENPMKFLPAVMWDAEARQSFEEEFLYHARWDPTLRESLSSVMAAMAVLGNSDEPEIYDPVVAREFLLACFSTADLYRHIYDNPRWCQVLLHIPSTRSAAGILDAVMSHPEHSALLAEFLHLAETKNSVCFDRFSHRIKLTGDAEYKHVDRARWMEAADLLVAALADSPSAVKTSLAQRFYELGGECYNRGEMNACIDLLSLVLQLDPSNVSAELLRRRAEEAEMRQATWNRA
jgi:hypothetical protein